LLDRFGITAEVLTLRDPELRYEVVRRRLAFERDPGGFHRDWEMREREEAECIRQAADSLQEVKLDEDWPGPLLISVPRRVSTACAAIW
jgi:Mg-chelatase subunit ChlI